LVAVASGVDRAMVRSMTIDKLRSRTIDKRRSMTIDNALVDAIEGLHASIDQHATALSERHHERLQCRRGCSGCCSDDLTVFEVEAAAIVRKHRALLENELPHPRGRCAFLDGSGGCRIYESRPYVCRTQGLPLRWVEERQAKTGNEPRELRDICPLNLEGGPPLEQLPPDACWPIGPVEARLSAIQAKTGRSERVSLRELFTRSNA
jgi:uncharacterized protein